MYTCIIYTIHIYVLAIVGHFHAPYATVHP